MTFKRQRFIALISLIMTSLASMAVNYSVKGNVVDSEQEAEPYATIRVFAATDTIKPVALGITGEEGEFILDLTKPGDFRIIISSVGKKPINKTFAVTTTTPVADLGTLIFSESLTHLDEIEVVATRPLVVKEIDRIGYDVQADEDSKTGTVQDILRKVPMVTVDADGTIKVKGSTNFKIYKDGRPNQTFSNNAKDIFAAIPAAMIKKIEVITDPGAKEDAEGVGAILNIVTVDNSQLNGIMGNLNLMYPLWNSAPMTNIWLTSNIGKVAFSVNGGYMHSDPDLHKSRSESDHVFADSGNRQLSTSRSRSRSNIAFWGVDGSYELDSLNLFTLEFGGFYHHGKGADPYTMDMLAPNGSTIYAFKSTGGRPHSSYLSFNGSFNYQRLTNLKDEVITLSYMVSSNRSDSETNDEYYDCINFPGGYTGLITSTDNKFIEHTGQADWARPFGPHNKVSIGAKVIYRDNHAISEHEYIGTSSGNDDFKHTTTVGAGYADYRFNSGNWSARAGLRYEFSRLSAKFIDGKQPNFASNLDDWVPNASVMYSLSEMSSIKASYSTRINRPGINLLSPVVIASPTSSSTGNPNLESTHHNTISLNYSLIKQKFNIDVSASYDFANNVITGITTVDPVSDYTSSTFANIGRRRNFDFDVFGQWTMTKWTTLMLNASVSYNYISLPDVSNSRWGTNIFFRATQRLPWSLRLEGFLYYGTGGLENVYSYEDNRSGSSIFHGFSLQRSFLKDDCLTVKLQAMNPFIASGSKMVTRYDRGPYIGTDTFVFENSRRFAISVGFRFGKVTQTVKKTRHTISNSDLTGGNQAPSSNSTPGGEM